MYTHCPHCDTYFRVTSAQLKSANGNVRCGRCFGTFNALQQLTDEPPTQKEKPRTEETTTDAKAQELEQNDPVKEPATSKQSIKRAHSQQLIEELQGQGDYVSTTGSKQILWGLLSIPLIILLVAQYGHFNLNVLSQQALYRPALVKLCELVKCEVPLLKAPQHFSLTHRDIRAHQHKKDVLVVKAEILNQANFNQPFPIMQLSMQDITGHTITGRRFLPKEYLLNHPIDIDQGIGPNKSHEILLELVDPGDEAVGFEFEFL